MLRIMLRSAAQIDAVRCKHKPKPSHVGSQRRKRQSRRTPCLERASCAAGCAGDRAAILVVMGDPPRVVLTVLVEAFGVADASHYVER